MTELDDNAQPLGTQFNRERRAERDVSELLGLAKGLLADGVVTVDEARHLRAWVGAHSECLGEWPLAPIHERLERMFADGRVSEEERADLQELLQSLVGGDAGVVLGDVATTSLPLDAPAPAITWTGSVFVFTGKFAFGPRAACEAQVRERGGTCEPRITQRTRYVVVGTFGSRDWIHTSFGRKLEKAVQYRGSGTGLAIVGEDHWAASFSERPA